MGKAKFVAVYKDAGADFDENRIHRFRLWRAWAPGARVLFVMLNPSTADETTLDPTLRRCEGFARAWGYSGFEVGNLWPFRSTDPTQLAANWQGGIDGGPRGLEVLKDLAVRCPVIVAGWGNTQEVFRHRWAREREAVVLELLTRIRPVDALRTTKDGRPGHPLYLAATTPLRPYRPQGWTPGAVV